MAGIVAEYARVNGAYERPTLRLLEYKWAPLVLAVFRTSFARDHRSLPSDRLHTQVDAYLAELAGAGCPVPSEGGRQLCLRWMRDQWLYRTTGGNGDEYSLTSHALEALEIVASMSRDRALLSESRLATILAAARRVAVEASSDVTRKLTLIDTQLAELQAERQRVAAGEDIVDPDRLIDGLSNLQDLTGQLPGDFKRVEESMQAMHKQVMASFRDDARPVGEVITDYLDGSDTLLQDTPEGRAFDGAFTLLRDDLMLAELRENLDTALGHHAASALTAAEMHSIASVVSTIRSGTDEVLSVRHRLSSTLRDHIVSQDIAVEREVDQLTRAIQRELAVWMTTARPRDRVTVDLLPQAMEIDSLKVNLYDPASDVQPPPLVAPPDDGPEPVSLEELRMLGGPSMRELRQTLAGTAGDLTVAELFNELPGALRRPVEVLGLLHAVDDTNRWQERLGPDETYEAIRADGTPVRLAVPPVTLTHDDQQVPS